jgi:hypothetical protein
MTETLLMLPLFLAAMFLVIELAQLGVALMTANYAASSIARKAANEQTLTALAAVTPAPAIKTAYSQKASDLMVAGMSLDDVAGCIMKDDPDVPTAELEVVVRTKIPAWPFFADLVHGALKSQYDPVTLVCPDTPGTFGPFNFSANAPYAFYVSGRARVRLNYVPTS